MQFLQSLYKKWGNLALGFPIFYGIKLEKLLLIFQQNLLASKIHNAAWQFREF